MISWLIAADCVGAKSCGKSLEIHGESAAFLHALNRSIAPSKNAFSLECTAHEQ